MILVPKKFSIFKDWNIDMILYSKDLCSQYPLVSLETIIKPRKEKIKAKDIPTIREIVSKIRFIDGKVFFKDRKIKNDMNKSCKNDLLVSNINFEKGAFAINTWGDVYASTDYTSYVIDTSKVIPEYLFLTLRCNTFMEYVASVKPKGMKTRARYEFIKTFNIPVPSLTEQAIILKEYHSTLEDAEKYQHNGDEFGSNLQFNVQSQVSSLKRSDLRIDSTSSIMKTIPFSSTKRWEVEYILKEGRLDTIYNSFKFSGATIQTLQTESLFGLSEKASISKKKDMIPVLRMTNVVNGKLDFSELKYLPLKSAITTKDPQKWLLKEGDLLITRTNGSKDLVGKAAVFHGNETYTYASYLIRYRFDTNIILPEYINILFMTPLVREQIAVMRRQGGGQYNLNSDEIGSIKIPVPSISEQQRIIDYFNSTKGGANDFYKKAQELEIKAHTDFEKCIFAM